MFSDRGVVSLNGTVCEVSCCGQTLLQFSVVLFSVHTPCRKQSLLTPLPEKPQQIIQLHGYQACQDK